MDKDKGLFEGQGVAATTKAGQFQDGTTGPYYRLNSAGNEFQISDNFARNRYEPDTIIVASPPQEFVVRDSGKRQEYPSGMRRDTTEGKPLYTLVPREMIKRLAVHLTKGAEKYGRENWKLANSQEELDRFKDSAFRHFMQWLDGERDEDHLAAILFNVWAAEHVQAKL